ncbi:MAG: DUF3040 domain-containing protein [Actinomycetia bacterium]|nr:DUF3040 domain-containing protein [Actinomycetes bacterium]
MPLSEHEQRLLEQMERQLYAEDPKLASTLRGTGRSLRSRHRLLFGVIGVGAGLALLVAGAASQLWPLGVAGFLVMLGGGWWASTGWQGAARGPTPASPQTPKSSQRSGFMHRIEERWDRRRDGDQ